MAIMARLREGLKMLVPAYGMAKILEILGRDIKSEAALKRNSRSLEMTEKIEHKLLNEVLEKASR